MQLLPSYFTFATLALLQIHRNNKHHNSHQQDGGNGHEYEYAGSGISAASVFTCQALLSMLIFPMNVYPWIGKPVRQTS